jgi:hypothetical protein
MYSGCRTGGGGRLEIVPVIIMIMALIKKVRSNGYEVNFFLKR